VEAVAAQHGRYNLTYREFDDFAQLRMSREGNAVGIAIERGALNSQIANDYWKRLRESGLIDFATIIYYSLLLLKKRPEILSYISAKFAWVLVDEFQDTTDLQVEILSLIAGADRTRFLLVGDHYQSVFGFAGARPDLADEFAARIAARTDIQLSQNFRSSKPIVHQANLIYPRHPPMEACGPWRDFSAIPVCQHGASAFEVLIDHFLPALDDLDIALGDAAVLAPTWYSLFPLGRRLREYGVSIVGPGARPYRRNRQFAPLAEHVCGYLMEPRPESIIAIERTLFNTLLDVTGRAYFEIFSYKGRVVVFELLDKAEKLRDENMGGIAWLKKAAEEFASILVADNYLSRSEQNVFLMSVEEMKADMRNNKVDVANLTIDDLGVYATPEAALKLSSLHNAKGREYAAVAMMDLHEGRIPFYQATTTAQLEEAKRLFYVGVTRAERFLMYITDSSDSRNQPSRFLRKGTGIGVC
jgi:DNA helicase-2/ATP-dependent DNA helicase PcrA